MPVDIRVVNPDLSEAVLPAAFEIETPDPFLPDVVALLSFDGDLSDFTSKTWTAFNSAATTTSQFRFGTHSLRTTKGSSAQYIEGPTSSDWAFGTDDFTAECWIRMETAPTVFFHSPFGNWVSGTGWCFFIDTQARIRFHLLDQSVAGGTVPVGQWAHIAAARESGVLRLFLDGSLVNSATRTQNLTQTAAVRIGQNRAGNNDGFPGWIDELRVTKGVARYTAAFTPPDSPFPRV